MFFYFCCHFIHDYAIESASFTKWGDFSLKYRDFLKFSAPAAPKIELNPFFPKNFQKLPFFGAFGAEKVVTERPVTPPPPLLWGVPPHAISDQYHFGT